MSNEKHYDYYVVDKEESAKAHALYVATVSKKRLEAQQQLLDETGAVAWRETRGWGAPDSISELVFPEDSPLVAHNHIKHCSRNRHEGKRVVCVRGKLNSKAGRAFNEPINAANAALEELPDFPDWLVHKHFKVSRTGLGARGGSGFGVSMLSTKGGFANDDEENLVFFIPNDKDTHHGTVSVPSVFTPISYGAMYDLTNKD